MKILLVLTILASSSPTLANAQDWKNYPYQDPASKIIFPRDEGAHPGVPNLEWWYAVLHLKGKTTGDQYSVLVSHFNNRIRFFTVANLTRQKHTSGSTLGFLHSATDGLDLTQHTKFGIDRFKSVAPFEYHLETYYQDMNINLEMSAIKKPLMVGGDGYLPVGNSGHSYYYSIPRLKAAGSLTYLGITEPVEGEAWIDHQWGPFVVAPFPIKNVFETYEWFCLQLDNGMDLMISNIFDRQKNLPTTEGYGGVQISLQNGDLVQAPHKIFKRTQYWQDPASKTHMSMGWTLDLPDQDIHLKLSPEYLDQMVKLPLKGSFWEGSMPVTGTVAGKAVTGQAFGELIHRYELPVLQLSKLKPGYQSDEVLELKWDVRNPDAGNPLNFEIYLQTGAAEVLLRTDIFKNEIKIPITELIAILDKDKSPLKTQIIVKARSVDGVIANRALTGQFLISLPQKSPTLK